MSIRSALLAVVAVAAWCASAAAQYSQVTTPFNTANSSFFERQGVGFNFNLHTGGNLVGIGPDGQPTPNGDIQFRQGSFGSALPPTGDFNSGTGLQSGFAINNHAGTFAFNFDFAQGSNTSLINETPTIVLPNGGTGFVSDSTVQPFVISLIPVVGQGGAIGLPYMVAHPYFNVPFSGAPQQYLPAAGPSRVEQILEDPQALRGLSGDQGLSQLDRAVAALPPPRASDPIARDLAAAGSTSSASRPAASVAAIRAARDAGQAAAQQEASRHFASGRKAEAEGKLGVARVYYQRGLKTATGELRKQLQSRLDDLSTPSRR